MLANNKPLPDRGDPEAQKFNESDKTLASDSCNPTPIVLELGARWQ